MSISAIGASSFYARPASNSGISQAKSDSDHDPAAVEAAESKSTKSSEKLNGGTGPIPTSASPTAASHATGVNILA
jgi:hypothetical protein